MSTHEVVVLWWSSEVFLSSKVVPGVEKVLKNYNYVKVKKKNPLRILNKRGVEISSQKYAKVNKWESIKEMITVFNWS